MKAANSAGAERIRTIQLIRAASAVIVGLTWGLMGASCLPFNNRPYTSDAAFTTLSINLTSPTSAVVIPQGTTFTIKWSGANLTGKQAVITLLARATGEIDGTILAGGIVEDGVSLSGSFDWDTTTTPGGTYRITVRVENGDETKEDTSSADVVVDAQPTLNFTNPTADEVLPTLDPNDPNSTATVLIRWQSGDADSNQTAAAQIELDSDTDHSSGNEFVIRSFDIPLKLTFDSFDFDGNDVNSIRVDAGTYHLYARVKDDFHDERIVEANVLITIPTEPNAVPTTTAITDPNDDVQFLTSDTSHTISMEFSEPNEVLIDLGIDRDDNHQNGNETTILFQHLVPKNTRTYDFEWDGQDKDGGTIQDGIYSIFMTVNRGSGTPSQVNADGHFLRRSDPNQPLISLLAPATDSTLAAGQFLTINWRDDVPSGTANVRLTIDDDDIPNETVETADPEIEILPTRDGGGDGVQDTFAYQIPVSLKPGRYHVFAYIDRDSAAPWDNISVAAGAFTVKDPNNP